MRRAGLKQVPLAEAIGASQPSVSAWLSGKSLPHADQLLAISRSLGVTVDWLLTGQGTKDPDSTRSPPTTDWRARALAAERQLAEIKALLRDAAGK